MSDAPWQLAWTRTFEDAARRFCRDHPHHQAKLDSCIRLLQSDPFAPSLRTHPLKGKHLGKHASSITWKYRIISVIDPSARKVLLLTLLGTHDEVY